MHPSPGKHWLSVPQDTYQNVIFRRDLLAECERSASVRRAIFKACSEDIIFFFNSFVWQTNPSIPDEEDGPFICAKFQREALWFTVEKLLVEQRPAIWEKSRKQGGTVMAIGLDVWLVAFHRRKKSIIMSHTEKAVERSEDEDTLFGKIEFMLDHLPTWMAESGRTYRKVSGVYRFKKMKSQVVGTSTTVRAGVGNRTAKCTADEFSKYQKAKEIREQLRETGPTLFIGTHYGVGGDFWEMCRTPEIAKFIFHWSKNPMYNRGLYRSTPDIPDQERLVDVKRYGATPPDYPFVKDGSPHGGPFPGLRSIYYDYLCKDRSAREMAMSWDIDPAGAAKQVYDKELIRKLIFNFARDPLWQGDVVYDPAGRFRTLKKREDGPLKLWVKFLPNAENTGRWMPPGEYMVGGDISAGTGATPSCLSGGNSLTGKKVLEYANAHVKEEEFAVITNSICYLLADPAGNPARLIWDATGPTGENFKRHILGLGFRNVWYWKDDFELGAKVTDEPGWYAKPESIRALHTDYEEALRKGYFENPSEIALTETLAFEYIEGGNYIAHGHSIRTDDPTAGRVNHSDIAQADALLWKLFKEAGCDKSPEERLALAGPPPGSIDWYIQQASENDRKNPFRR